MSLVKEFKVFIARGNMVDLAIAVIMGAAFGKIVNSLVNDIIMPPIGFLLGGVDFSSLAVVIKKKTATHLAVLIKYGVFINTIIDFLIISIVVFFLVKAVNRVKETPPPSTKECPECLMAIPIKAKKCCHCSSAFN